jgi:hypothetical protein
MRNLQAGQPTPISTFDFEHPLPHSLDAVSQLTTLWMWPCRVADPDGSLSGGSVGNVLSAALLYCDQRVTEHGGRQQMNALVRELMASKHTPCMVTVLDQRGEQREGADLHYAGITMATSACM